MTKKPEPKRPPGRPRYGTEPMKRIYVTLDSDSVDKAREIGGGSVSEGIRRAVKEYRK